MYLRAVVVLALMAAQTTAGPLIPEQQHECARTCIESGKFSYEIGKRYIYDYEAVTSVSSEHSADSKYQIRAQAEIEPISKCNFVLRLKEVSLEDGFKYSDEGRQSAEEMRSALEKYALVFSYQDGKIDHLCPDPSDQIWAINIKRGVLTVFQNTMDNIYRDHFGHEIDIAGRCPVTYKVTEQNADHVIVTKTKDVDNCKDRYDIASSVKTSMDVESVPLLKSTHDCEHKIKDGILQDSSCKENYQLRPFSTSNGKSATAFATISLTLKFEAPGTGFPKGDVSKRSSLTFEHSESPVKNLGINDAKLALGELCNATREDIRPQVPRLFSRFVNKLKNLDYDEITEVYHSLNNICSNTRNAKKIFFDATSLTASSSAILLMKKLIDDNEITYSEAELWLLSLALVPKPTEEILSAAIGILDNNQLTGKALLGISSLGYSYCKTQTNCKESPIIKKLSQKLVNIMGPLSSKYPIPDDRKEMIILAIKAIGNLGLVEPIVTAGLESIHSDPSNLKIRLAGIDALRRVQCNEMPTDVMMRIFSNVEEDAELRIAAYLNLMKCPNQNIFSAIKFALHDEEVSQVGSFVWTHLTNIQESIDPWKKNITSIIGDQVLFKKFSSDFRKFSRFYETSIYSDSLKTGAHIEGNVIFTPNSYLPRSAKLDLDIDIFGNRIDLFELGGRMEGFEYLVESFFGPNGYFPEDTIKDVLKSYRNKKPYDDNKLNNITKMYNQLNPQESPKGSLYLRVFGNEIKSFNFNNIKSNSGRPDSNNLLQGLLTLLDRETTDITNSFTFLDSCVTVPTMTGFPLKLKVNGTAAVNMKMGAETSYRDEVLSMKGYLRPSAAVEITGSMMVDGITSESGVVMLATGHTSTDVEGIFLLKRGELFSARVNFPREKLEILNVQTSFYTARNGIVSPRKYYEGDTNTSNSCVGENLSKYTGMKLCTENKQPPKMATKPSLIDYISNPVTYKIAVVKTDPTLVTYDFNYRWHEITDESGKIKGPIGKIGHISFDTPGSAIDREMTVSFRWTYPNNSVNAVINTPLKKMELNGQFSNSDDKKGFETSVKMDGREVLNVTCDLRKEKQHHLLRIIPRFYLRIREKEVADVKGFVQYQEDNFKVDMDISHLTSTPISFKGHVGKVETANSSRHDVEVSLNTPVISASSKGFYQLIGSSASTRFTFNYNVLSSKVETIELNAKFIDSSASQIVKKSASVELKSTAIPSANWAIAWDTHKYKGYMNNILELSHGPYQKLSLKQQHRSEGEWPYPLKASGSIEMQYPSQDVDYRISYNHVSSDILLDSLMVIKYAPEGEIELKGSIHNNRAGQLMDRKIFLGITYPSTELKFAANIQQPSVNEFTGDVKIEIWDGMWIQVSFATNKTTMPGNVFGRNIQAKVITHRGEPFAMSADVLSTKIKTTVNGVIIFGKTRYSAQLQHELDKTTRHLSAVVTTPLATHKGSLDIRSDATHKGAAFDLTFGDLYHMTADGFVKNDHQSKQGHIMMNLDANKNPNDNIILDYKYKPAKEANEGVITVEYPKWKPISIKYGSHYYNEKNSSEYTFRKNFDVTVGNKRLVAASIDLRTVTESPKRHLEGVIQLDVPYFRINPKLAFIHDTVHGIDTRRWRSDITASNGANTLFKVITSGSGVYSNDGKHLIGNLYLTSPYNEKVPLTVDIDVSSKLDKLNTGVKIVLPSGKTFLINYGVNDMSTDSEKILEGNLNITTPFEAVRDISISGKVIISDRVSIQTDLAWNDLKIGAEIDAKVASEKHKWSAIANSKFTTSVPGFEKLSSSLRLLLQPSSMSTMGEIVWQENKKLAVEVLISGEKTAVGGLSFVTSIHLLSPFHLLEDILFTTLMNNVEEQSRYTVDFKWAPERSLAVNFMKRTDNNGKTEAVFAIDTPFEGLRHAEADSIIQVSSTEMLLRVGCQYNVIRASLGVNLNQSFMGLQGVITFSSNIPTFEAITTEFDVLKRDGDYFANAALTLNEVRSNAGYQMTFDKKGGFDTTIQLKSPFYKQLKNLRFNVIHKKTDETLQLNSLFTKDDETLMSLDAEYGDRKLPRGRETDGSFALKSPYGNIGPARWDFKHENRNGFYNPQASFEYKPGKRIKIQTELSVGAQKGVGKLLVKTPFTSVETLLELNGHYALIGARKTGDLTVEWLERKVAEITVSGQGTAKQGGINVNVRTPFQGIGVIAGELMIDAKNANNKTIRAAIRLDQETYELVASSEMSKRGGKYVLDFKISLYGLDAFKLTGFYLLGSPDKYFKVALETAGDHIILGGGFRLMSQLMDSYITLNTTMRSWELLEVKANYDTRNTDKVASVKFLNCNESYGLKVRGHLLPNSGTFMANTTWLTSSYAELSGSYAFNQESKVVEGTFRTGNLSASLITQCKSSQGSGDFRVSFKSTIPDFQEINVYTTYSNIGFQKSATVLIQKDEIKFDVRGELIHNPNSLSASLSLETPFDGFELINVTASHRLGYNMIRLTINDGTLTGVLSYKLAPRTTHQNQTTKDTVTFTVTLDKFKCFGMASMLKNGKDLDVNILVKTPWNKFEKFGMKAVRKFNVPGTSLLFRIDHNDDIYQVEGLEMSKELEYGISAGLRFPTYNERLKEWNIALYSTLKFAKGPGGRGEIIHFNNTALLNELRNEIIIVNLPRKGIELTFKLETFDIDGHVLVTTDRTSNGYVMTINSKYSETTVNITIKKSLDNLSLSLVGNSWLPEFSTFTLQGNLAIKDKYEVTVSGTRNSEMFSYSGTLVLKKGSFEGVITSDTSYKGVETFHVTGTHSSHNGSLEFLIEVKANDGIVVVASGLYSVKDSEKSFELNITGTPVDPVKISGLMCSKNRTLRIEFSVQVAEEDLVDFSCALLGNILFPMIAEIKASTAIGFEEVAKFEMNAFTVGIMGFDVQWGFGDAVLGKVNISVQLDDIERPKFDAEVLYNEQSFQAHAYSETTDSVKGVNFTIFKNGLNMLAVVLQKTEEIDQSSGERKQSAGFILKMAPDVVCEIKLDFSPSIFKSNFLLHNPYITYYNMRLATVLQSDNGKHTARFSVHMEEDLQTNVEIDIDTNELKFRAGIVSNINGWEIAEISSRIEQTSGSKGILAGVLYQEKQSSFSALASKLETGVKFNVAFDSQFEMLTPFGAVAQFTTGDETKAIFYVYVGDERMIDFSFSLTPSPEAGGIIISFKSPLEIINECYFQLLYDLSKPDKNGNLKAGWNEKNIKADWYATLEDKKLESVLQLTLPHNEEELLRFLARYDATEEMSKRGVLKLSVENVTLDIVGNVDFEKDGGATVSIQATTPFSGLESIKIAGYHYVQKPGSPYELNVTANDDLLWNMRGKLRHNLPLSFDGTLSAFSPMFFIENIGVRYELEKKMPYRSGFAELILGDDQKIKLIGTVSPITINLELTTPFESIQQVSVTGRLNSRKNALGVNSIVSINGNVFSIGGDLKMKYPDYFIFDLEISTPFKDYSKFALSCFLKNKQLREVEGFFSLSTPFKSVANFKATSKFSKTKDGAIGFVELPFGKYEILTSYQEDVNQKKGKVTVQTPHKGFRSITLDGYLQQDGEYRYKFEAGSQTAHGRYSLSGNLNTDPSNREIVLIFKCPAVKNAPLSFRGQLKNGRGTYDFDASISTPSASHRIYGGFGKAEEADLFGEANIECKSSLQNATYFSLISDFKINKGEFVGSLAVSRKEIPTKSFTLRTKRSSNELYAQMDQSNIFASNFRSLAIRGKFLPNNVEISFITPSKTYSIVTNYKLAANGFQGKVTIDPPVFKTRAVTLDWTITKGKRFYFDGNVVVETDRRNSIHIKADTQNDRVIGEINVQSPSTGIGTFSTTGTLVNQNRRINGRLDITIGNSVHSAELDFGFTGMEFEAIFTLDSTLLPAKTMTMKSVYVKRGPSLTVNVDYGALSHKFAAVMGTKDGRQSATLILDSPLISGGKLEINYESFSMNYGKNFECKFKIANEVFNHEGDLKFRKENMKWFGSLVVSSSSLGNGKKLELYGSFACERPESCEVVLGFNSGYDAHEITLSMNKGVTNTKTTLHLKSPLVPEGETTLIADMPKSFGNLNSHVILGLWTPSKNHTISGTIHSSPHNLTADFNVTSPYAALEGVNIYLSIKTPLRFRREIDAHLLTPFLFKEPIQFNGAVEKVQKGYKGHFNNRFPTFGEIRTSWKVENNEWNPAVLQGNIQTPLANNTFQLMIRKGPEQILTELLLESPCLPSGSMKINVDMMKEKFQVFRINLGVELSNEKFELRNTFTRNGMTDYKLEVEALTPWEGAFKTKVVGIFRHNIRELMAGIELHRNDVKKISIHSSFIKASRPSIEGTVYLNTPFDGVNDISATFRYLNDAPNTTLWHVGLWKDADVYSISRRSYQTDTSNIGGWVLEFGERKFEMKTSRNRSRFGGAAEIELFSFVKQNPEYSFGFLFDTTNVPVVVKTEISFPEGSRWFINGSMEMKNWYNFEGSVAFGDASGRRSDWTRRLIVTRQNTGKSTVLNMVSTRNSQKDITIDWENTEHLNGSGQGHLQFTTPFKKLHSAAISYFRDASSKNGHRASSLSGNLNGQQLLGLTTTSIQNTHVIEVLNPISPITVSYTYSKKAGGITIRGKFTLDNRRPQETSSNFEIEVHYPAGQLKYMSIEIISPARTVSISLKNDVIKNGFFRQLNLKWGPDEKQWLRFDAISTREEATDRNTFLAHLPSGTIKLVVNNNSSKEDLNVTVGIGFDSDTNNILKFKLERKNGYTADETSRTILMAANSPALGKGIDFRGSMNTSSSKGTLIQMHTKLNFGVDDAISHITIRIPVGPTTNYHFLFGARTLTGEKGFHLESYMKQDANSFEGVISSGLEGLHRQLRKLVLTVDKVNKTFELKCNNGNDVAEVSGGLSREELYGNLRFNGYALSTAVGKVPDQRKVALNIKSGDTKYYCTFGLENNKEIVMEVVKDSVSHKGSQFKLRTFLNQSRELVTQITWKPNFPQELKDICDQGWHTVENIINCIIMEPANVLHDMESFGSDLLNNIRKEFIEVENNLRKKYPEIAAFIDRQLEMVYNFFDEYAWFMKDVLSSLNYMMPPTRYFEYALHWTSSAIRDLMDSIYTVIADTFNRTSFWEFWTGAVKYSEELFVRTVCYVGRSVVSGALKMSKYFVPVAYEKLKSAEEWILQTIAKIADLDEQQLMKVIKEIASEAYDEAISEIQDHIRNITNAVFTSEQFQQFASVFEIISSFTYSVVDFLASDANLEFAVGRLVDLVKNFAVHTLRTTVIKAIPWPRVEVFDPVKGEITITQRLPLDWSSFTELPNLQDIDFSQNIADFYQYVDQSMEDIYYSYKFDSDYKNWIPPFKKRALVVGGKYFITFDGRSYKFDGPCTYLLASDFVDGNFTAVVGPGGNRKNIHVEFKDVSINFPLTEDVDQIPVGFWNSETSIRMSGNVIFVENKRGVQIMYDTTYDIFMMEISGWYFGKTSGLFGNSDNEYHNDIMQSTGKPASYLEEFAESWNVGKSCERGQSSEDTYMELPTLNKVCSEIFINSNSTLRSCFKKVDPMFFLSMCTVKDKGPGKNIAICQAAVAYQMMCEAKGVSVHLPHQCRTCQYQDKIIEVDETILVRNDSRPTTVDVIYVIEKGCQDDNLELLKTSSLKMNSEYETKYGEMNANYFVVGYGGSKTPARVVLGEKIQYGRQNALEAISFAAATEFSLLAPSTTKTIILLPCSSCSRKAMSGVYGKVLNELMSRNIKLHIIVPQRSAIKMPGRVKDLEILGFDKDSTSMKRISDGKLVHGNADMRRQVTVPKDLCLTMSLETGGSIHRDNFIHLNDKPTSDWFTDRVTFPADKPCEKCKCVKSSDGSLKTICSLCTPADKKNPTHIRMRG